MSVLKKYREQNVLDASQERINFIFDSFDRIYLSFSAGKDSTVMLHLVMQEAIKRDRKIGVLLVDLEAQYKFTMEHAENCFNLYREHIEPFWCALPLSLRNAVSNYQPKWLAWDPDNKEMWVRNPPDIAITDENYFPFFQRGFEFEEFVPEFGEWYAQGKTCACLVGIRTDESLNRFRTIAQKNKIRFQDKAWTTKVTDNVYNAYPIYDWSTSDLWHWHYLNPSLPYNQIYEQMHKAGLSPSQMRICQPYGDDQRRGLWLYHILEPATWYKVIARVNGVNSGALYIQESGNITGYHKITKPENHSWKSFCNLLLATLPKSTSDHYVTKFKVFLKWWKERGYEDGIPDEAPLHLEAKRLAPSWRRLCKVLLRNDWWCKGLCFSQPKSAAYGKFLELKKKRVLLKAPKVTTEDHTVE